ncbi:glucan phosphoethanolaminetransferase (alkaline phosphatase superfamily) [Fictibacillus halophilus]|uniref:Glucan phosphoethanolaminetransferase (Alkaline phosphatase superfamily) n=1 Tax=Fictibacillus halophilus TaxID=1610490 RepID=A0ABV2LNX5_9BACL|nr:hypothetical protein [Fictibacillus halophilus]
MKKKQIDWFFGGPMFGIVILSLLLFSTSATKLPNGNYILDQDSLSYFLVGCMFVCAILLILGKIRETMEKKIHKNTIIITLLLIPIVFVFVHIINN